MWHPAKRSTSYRAIPADGVAWITGASSGIGRSLALQLAQQGFRVAVTARRAELLSSLVDAGAGKIISYPGDVTDCERMRQVVAEIEDELGPIALAVLNAGVYDLAAERGRFDADIAWRNLEVNLGGVVRCLDPLLGIMLRRRRGQIAIVASLAGYGGIPGSTAYGAGKSALITLAEALAMAHRRDGISVQVVNPGFVDTAMTAPNDYAMPFMMNADDAAVRIAKGLKSKRFEIAFPMRLVWPMKLLQLLPYRLWLPLVANITSRTQR